MSLISLRATTIKNTEPCFLKLKENWISWCSFFGRRNPSKVPDHISLWGSLLKFRREFDQYVNLRPVKLFEGVPCPLANKKPGDIDMIIVRENTEGEYSSVGGKCLNRQIEVQLKTVCQNWCR